LQGHSWFQEQLIRAEGVVAEGYSVFADPGRRGEKFFYNEE